MHFLEFKISLIWIEWSELFEFVQDIVESMLDLPKRLKFNLAMNCVLTTLP